jgi:hypothetical protein
VQQYPDAHWPVQITQALQGLIHAANIARAHCLSAVPGHLAAPLIHAFKHGVLVGLSEVPRIDPYASHAQIILSAQPREACGDGRRARAVPKAGPESVTASGGALS